MLNQYNGIVIGGGKDSNVAYHVVSSFVVPAGQGGPWSLRWGPDWGWGGTLLVDGVELKSRWSAMWWNGNWNDANQQLQGTVTLTPGTHTVEVYGFEDCCDGVTDAQLMSPVGTWTDLTVASFNASAPPCGPDVTLAATAPATIAAGTQMTYRFDWANDGS